MRRRLFSWIYPPYLISALLCATAFTAFTARTASGFFFELSSLELRQSARVVATALSPLLDGEVPLVESDLAEFGGKLSSGTELRISVISPDGRMMADTREDPARLENHAGRVEFIEALERGEGSASRVSASTGIPTVYEAIAVKGQDGEIRAIVRTAMPFSIISSRRRELILAVLGFGLALSLAVSLLALILAKGIADPIRRLDGGARDFASGKLDMRLPEEGPRELANLAAVMNGMARELGLRIGTIQEQKNQVEAILNGMSEAVAVLSPGLRVVMCNPAFRRLFPGGEGDGLLTLTGNTEICAFAESALRADGPLEAAINIYGDGAKRLRLGSSPIEDGRAVIVMNDMTRLDRLETIRRDFTANVSHELKTPITAIRGALETLAGDDGGRAASDGKFIDMALRNTERLEAILADLLSLATIEEEESGSIEKTLFDLDGLIDSVVADLDGKIRDSGMTYRRDGERGIALRGHEGLIRQALSNLMDNAVKYAAAGRELRVASGREGGMVRITVSDRGPGIPKRDRDRIFERFYRVDKARSRDSGGTGLGLAIVRHIALAHSGSVSLESAEGVGSAFSIILPGA